MYKYFHDADKRIVYKIPERPSVIDMKDDNTGRRNSWFVDMEVHITRADNKMVNGRWQHNVFLHPSHSYEPNEKRDDAEFYFLQSNRPKGVEILEAEYEWLHIEYEAEARFN